MNILVVDDSEDGRDITEAVLLDAGYKGIATAGSAADAFGILTIGATPAQPSAGLDLLLLDIVMPEMDGIEACARIRNDPRYADVPIIMLTSLGDVDSLASAFDAGATDYIMKPLNRTELLARVGSALKLKTELNRRHAREHELLQFMSSWGDRRAARWVDYVTGLFVGEVAEAYIIAAPTFPGAESSVIALAVDGMTDYRKEHGKAAAQNILVHVARAVRAATSAVGVVAAVYPSGVIVLVAPELPSEAAKELAETLRTTVAQLAITNQESDTSESVTASLAVVSSCANLATDRANLISRAVLAAPRISAAGGDRVEFERMTAVVN